MKKVAIFFVILMCVFACFTVNASSMQTMNNVNTSNNVNNENNQNNNMEAAKPLEDETSSKLIEIKEKGAQEVQDYIKSYDNNETYGWTAFILSKVRIFSIPCCFIGIAVGAIYQYVIGIRRADLHDRGFLLIIAFVTIFVICQILPLVFAIVVKGFAS